MSRLKNINTSRNNNTVCLCVFRVMSENEFEDGRKGEISGDELYEPYPHKRWVQIISCKVFRFP